MSPLYAGTYSALQRKPLVLPPRFSSKVLANPLPRQNPILITPDLPPSASPVPVGHATRKIPYFARCERTVLAGLKDQFAKSKSRQIPIPCRQRPLYLHFSLRTYLTAHTLTFFWPKIKSSSVYCPRTQPQNHQYLMRRYSAACNSHHILRSTRPQCTFSFTSARERMPGENKRPVCFEWRCCNEMLLLCSGYYAAQCPAWACRCTRSLHIPTAPGEQSLRASGLLTSARRETTMGRSLTTSI